MIIDGVISDNVYVRGYGCHYWLPKNFNLYKLGSRYGVVLDIEPDKTSL